MPQINKIISKLEAHYDILDFLSKNYPDILKEWKLGSGPTKAPEPATGQAAQSQQDVPQHDYNRPIR